MHECISWVFTLFSMQRTFKKKKKKCIMGGRWNVVAAVSEPNRWFTLKRAEAPAAGSSKARKPHTQTGPTAKSSSCRLRGESRCVPGCVKKNDNVSCRPTLETTFAGMGDLWPLGSSQPVSGTKSTFWQGRTHARTTPGVARRPYAARSAFLPGPMN